MQQQKIVGLDSLEGTFRQQRQWKLLFSVIINSFQEPSNFLPLFLNERKAVISFDPCLRSLEGRLLSSGDVGGVSMAHLLGTLLTVPCSETASGISISGLTEPGRRPPVLLCALFMLHVAVVAFEHELAL